MSLVMLALLVRESCVCANGRPALKRVVGPGLAPARAAKRAEPPREPDTYFLWPVEGWGVTREDAEQSALRKAQRKLLTEFNGPGYRLEWVPSLDYIKKHMVKEAADQPAQDYGPEVGVLQGIILRIGISSKDWQSLLREDRQVRSESRMLLLTKFLVGIVALLGAVAGYLRLEEMTKGYYTAWLRLAAIGFVSAVGAGIWWIS